MSQNDLRIEITQQGLDESLRRIQKLVNLGEDTRDIWEEWIKQAHTFWMQVWGAQGTPFGKRWQGLSAAYKKRKKKRVGSAKADLIYSGRLKSAVGGGDGWSQSIDKNSIEFGINLPYASIHQFGGRMKNGYMPQRPYLMPADNKTLPAALATELEIILNKKIMENE